MSSTTSSRKRKAGGSRSIWRAEYFLDHPGYDPNKVANSTESSVTIGKKAKVYCKACYEHHVAHITAEEMGHPNARTMQQIGEYLWGLRRKDQPAVQNDERLIFGYMSADLQSMRHHLTECKNVPPAVNQLAMDEELQLTPSKRQKRRQEREQHLRNLKAFSTAPPDAGASTFPPYAASGQYMLLDSPPATRPPSSIASSSSIGGLQPPQAAPGLPRVLSHAAPSPQSRTTSLSYPIDPNLIPPPSPPGSFVGNFSDDRSSSSGSSSLSQHRAWPAPPSAAPFIANKFAAVHWTSADQQRFERLLAELTASAGFALSWTGNPAWIALLAEFLPFALNPSRYVLTHTLIPAAVTELRREAQVRAAGKLCTLQEDGWTGINSHYIIAYMLSTGSEVHTVRVYDETGQPRDAEHLADLTMQTIEHVSDEWNVEVIAFASDAGGESRKGRKIVVQRRPEIFAPDCYSHQLQLVVGDYVDKSDSPLRDISDKADDLIAWIRGKTFVVFLLKQAQESSGRGAALSVIRAALTRWTSHYLAYERLLTVQSALNKVVNDDEFRIANGHPSQIIKGDTKAKAKARAMIVVVKDGSFWENLLTMKRMLEPLAKAAYISQATSFRPDEVLLIFGGLVHEYKKMSIIDVDIIGRSAILASLEKRWAKCEQEVYIATAMVNPFVFMAPFKKKYNISQLFDLFSKLYRRFFKVTEDPEGLFDDVRNYVKRLGEFSNLDKIVSQVKVTALKKKEAPDPMRIWDALVYGEGQDRPLVKLTQLLLSICCNSASCERLFSVFGTILTKSRSRMATKTLEALAELRLYIRDREKRDQSARERLKEHYSAQKRRAHDLAVRAQAAAQAASEQALAGGATESGPAQTHSSSFPSPLPTAFEPRDPAQASTSPGRFTTVMDDCIRAVDDDEDLGESLEWPGASQLIPLDELFDFEHHSWTELMDLQMKHSLDEEMAIYELLDFDAPGEIDDDAGGHELDADAMAEAIFT